MRTPKRTRKRRSSSDLLPADVLLTLPELDIHVEKMQDGEAWAKCPGHEVNIGRADHSASWSINLESGAHNCFSCGFGGRFIDLVAFMQDLEDDPEKAREWVRKRGGIAVASKKLTGEGVFEREQAIEVSEAELVMFDDPPPRALRDRDLDLESCLAYGVRYDLKRKHWIIPIRDPYTGKLMGWQAKGKDYFANYPKHVEKSHTLFGYDLLKGQKTAYLEESPLDAVRLHTYSIDGAVSGYGVHVSTEQMDLIVESVDTLYVCLDNDAAGRSKERKIWQQYRGRVRLYFANYDETDKKDHGEMTPEEIEYSLTHAISAVRFRP